MSFVSYKGKPVQLITLKSLLRPNALGTLDPKSSFLFCSSPQGETAYYSENGSTYTKADVKVPIYPKDESITLRIR
jgi:hypothetical protein